MTDAEKLREIAEAHAEGLAVPEIIAWIDDLRRIADLLDSVPPEVLKALANKTWKAVPVISTYEMQNAAWHACFSGDFETYVKAYRAMLAAAPEMLEALEDIAEWVGGMCSCRADDEYHNRLLAVIARAKTSP
jgi:hypothetical protein